MMAAFLPYKQLHVNVERRAAPRRVAAVISGQCKKLGRCRASCLVAPVKRKSTYRGGANKKVRTACALKEVYKKNFRCT